MLVSHISDDRCDLFEVTRTDTSSGQTITLTYPPRDFRSAIRLAATYQAQFGAPHICYRASACSGSYE